MRRIFSGLIFFIVSLGVTGQPMNGYQISFKINGLRDSTVFLAYHLGDKQYILDTIKLDASGSAQFSGREALQQGIYMIVLPGKRYFEILIPEDQHFSFTCSFDDPFSTLSFSGSAENTSFVEYQKNWVKMQQRASGISRRLQNNKQNNDSVRIITEAQKLQEERMRAYLKTVISENGSNLLSLLVKAMLPVDIPPVIVPLNASNPDSLRWILTYLNNKNHYFDNIDLNDERLIRTPILQSRLKTFFTNVVIQAPDSINKEIDRVIKRSESNYKMFQFISVWLFNHFRESGIMGHDGVIVKLADDIYLSGKADWVSKEFKDDLRRQVELIRPNLIGRKAVDLVMDSYRGVFVSLFDIESDFTVLYFWEPDCGHCNVSTPKLRTFYETAKDAGVEVFTVCTSSDRAKWSKYIEENKLVWINGWDPQRSTRFDFFYNVQSTPLIYILDRSKTIIAKKISVEDVGPFIESYRKAFRQ
jgi:peroxiredoxin